MFINVTMHRSLTMMAADLGNLTARMDWPAVGATGSRMTPSRVKTRRRSIAMEQVTRSRPFMCPRNAFNFEIEIKNIILVAFRTWVSTRPGPIAEHNAW